MVAEHFSHERACGEELCRLFEGLWQGVYSRRGALIRSHVIDIGVSRRGNGQVALDAVETGGEAGSHLKIGVASRVGAAYLNTGAEAACRRNSYKRAAVLSRPSDIYGSLIAGHEAFIRIDKGIEHEGHRADMLEHTGDEAICGLAEIEAVALIAESVFARLEQRDVGVHARTADAVNGFGHESRMKSVRLGDALDDILESHDIVCGGQNLVVFEIYLMLSLGDLMVGRFYFKAHLLECEADVTAAVLAAVNGAEVEIAALIVGLSGGLAVFVDMEQEEFALRTDIARIAHIRRFLYRAAQDIARVALKGSAV